MLTVLHSCGSAGDDVHPRDLNSISSFLPVRRPYTHINQARWKRRQKRPKKLQDIPSHARDAVEENRDVTAFQFVRIVRVRKRHASNQTSPKNYTSQVLKQQRLREYAYWRRNLPPHSHAKQSFGSRFLSRPRSIIRTWHHQALRRSGETSSNRTTAMRAQLLV